jgi:hypothetical protein
LFWILSLFLPPICLGFATDSSSICNEFVTDLPPWNRIFTDKQRIITLQH